MPNRIEGAVSSNVCTDTGYEVSNADAKPTAQGSVSQQLEQAAYLTEWSKRAFESAFTDESDVLTRGTLSGLGATPPDTKKQTEYVDYTSTLKGVSAESAFEYFKNNPSAWFGASGITLHPPTNKLEDGARLFLQEPGITPPVWAPIEVHVDERAKTVRITTLDGHPLRGVNQFSFDENTNGDCELRQSSAFQMSSFAASVGGKALALVDADPIARQHVIWQAAHANIADHAERK
ncbi:MAG: hypothetical protein JNK82_32630 [Myxococcaceae bacterium]|nr:hypothetical protein [Myxococcaceae bacterium]